MQNVFSRIRTIEGKSCCCPGIANLSIAAEERVLKDTVVMYSEDFLH